MLGCDDNSVPTLTGETDVTSKAPFCGSCRATDELCGWRGEDSIHLSRVEFGNR